MATKHDAPLPGAAFTEQIDVPAAAGVIDDDGPADPAAQAAFFDREGYLVLRGVLGRDELASLDRDLTTLARKHASTPGTGEGFDLEPNKDRGRATPGFRKIGGVSRNSDAFRGLLTHPRIASILGAILGDEVYLFRDVVMMKPAKIGREKPWHQDAVYWPWRPMNLVSVMTALDDATPENGCLQIIPGSHQETLQHHGDELRVDLTTGHQARTRFAPLRAGDALVFHSLLLHASQPNRSDHDRRVCIFAYRPGNVTFLGEGDPPDAMRITTE
ncbi:MAG: hypothetical protein CMJ18_18505 [Phycisphaeraceae bacterium]|nr:hypothetical protein [Phycisphaeraceae bacterium]